MKKTKLRLPALIARSVTLAVVAAFALSACGADDDTDSAERSQVEESASTSVDQEDEGTDADGAADEESVRVPIGTEFTDEGTGDQVTIISAIRNVPTDHVVYRDKPEGEMIYLEVKIVPRDNFPRETYMKLLMGAGSFFLDEDGEPNLSTDAVKDEMEDAGYEYFDVVPRKDGERTAYLAFWMEPSSSSEAVKGYYIRDEIELPSDDTTIPEERHEFEVPAA